MLYYETIDTSTLELLKRLLAIPSFSSLRLAGGTSLALQYGHRKSIDIDLFGEIDIDGDSLSSILTETGEVKRLNNRPNIHIYTINGVKVDIVNYPYRWIDELLVKDGLRLASDKDISAMKLAAITGRGTKKDFIDLFELLQHYSLSELIGFYEQKYHDGSVFLVLKSLVYFEDADAEITPYLLRNYSWEDIKTYIKKVHVGYMKNIG
ncbi:MAG: nucleotidyl transferase AbiEii/AbiGii toxin family protein [Bacteroidota bacterium]